MQKTQKDKNKIPDYEELFREGAEEKNNKKSSGIQKMLLKQNTGKIIISMLLYIVKNSPAWAIPLITAEVINLISEPDGRIYEKLFLYGAVLFVLLIQNIPTHALLYERYVNNTLRTIGAGLRNTLIKKLQHLSLTYRKEIETGKIQSKFLRDIEAIEFFNSYFIKSVLLCILNVIVSIAVVLMKSKIVTLFFMIVIPVNVGIICFFRSSMSNSNKKFRKETENISAKVSDMLGMLPITKAHGLENEEIAACEENIRKLREKGLILDNVNAYFGSVTWVLSQLMSAGCLFFTAFLDEGKNFSW